MKRLLVALSCAAVVTAFGCTRRYEYRLNKTLDQKRYQMRLDQFLNPAETGSFQELGVFLRAPKPLSRQQHSAGLPSADPAAFELLTSFADLDGGTAKKKSENPSALRLNVLARVKRPKKPAGKKGEPPPVDAPRGDFATDVRSLLSRDFGNESVNDTNTTQAKAEKKGNNDYRKVVFKASNDDDIHVYFYKQGDYEAALIWDIPGAAAKSPAAATGIDLCLESFAVGQKALNKFRGDTEEEAAEGGGGEASGQAF